MLRLRQSHRRIEFGIRDEELILQVRQLGGILGDLLPPPLPSVVDHLPVLGPVISGGGSQSPRPPAPAPAPAHTPSPPSSTSGGSSPSTGGGSSPSTGGGSSPPTSGSSSPSTGGSSSPSTGGSPSHSSGGSSSPSTGGSSPSSGGNSSPSSGGSSSSSTGGSSSPSAGGSFPSDGGSGGGSSSSSPSGSSTSSGSSNGGSSSGSSGVTGVDGSDDSGSSGNPSSSSDTSSSPTTQNGSSTGSPQPSNSNSNTAIGNTSSSSADSTNASTQSSSAIPGIKGPVANADNVSGVIHSIPGSASATNSPDSINGPMGNGPNAGSSALAAHKHTISSGAIAGITIVIIFLLSLSLIIFVLRRRFRMRRNERQNKWWFATTGSPQTYGDITNPAEDMPAGTHSARSSFVTTVDRSEPDRATYHIPPFPPAMAEIGRGNGTRPTLIIGTSDENNNDNTPDYRFSIGSDGSDHSQYVIVPHPSSANSDLLATTPMSVRPFSPSESFAFPRPPEPAADGSSRPTSSALSVPTTPSKTSAPPGLPSIPTFVPLVDQNDIKPPSPAKVPALDPFNDNNPFDDPITPTIIYSTFSDIQAVCHSFVPTLPDELAVEPEDSVRVLHSFDDGWALVEIVTRSQGSSSQRMGKKENEPERGLIPMYCLKKDEQDFIANRASSCEPFVI